MSHPQNKLSRRELGKFREKRLLNEANRRSYNPYFPSIVYPGETKKWYDVSNSFDYCRHRGEYSQKKYYLVRSQKSRSKKFIKSQSRRAVRRKKMEDYSDYAGYRKLYDLWWELY